MKKIPFNHKIALENPKAVVKTKNGLLVTDLKYRTDAHIYALHGRLNYRDYGNRKETWTEDGIYSVCFDFNDHDLELYVPFTSFWDRIKYYLKTIKYYLKKS